MARAIRNNDEVSLRIRLRDKEREWFHQIAAAQNSTLTDLIKAAVGAEGVRCGIPAPVRSL